MRLFKYIMAAITTAISATSIAGTLYSSAMLANQEPAALTWNAYGVGFVDDQNSIQFASPFASPSFAATATQVRIAAGIESGENSFRLSILSGNAGLPETPIIEVTVLGQLLPARSGNTVDHWISVELPHEIDLLPNSSYWISLSSARGSTTFLNWQQPGTDVAIRSAYRNSSSDDSWIPMYPYMPPAFELIGDVTSVPEPSIGALFLFGFALLKTSIRKSSDGYRRRHDAGNSSRGEA